MTNALRNVQWAWYKGHMINIPATSLCAAASAAYSSTPTFVVAGDVHVVFYELADVTIVAFRGTEPTDLKDWIRDFDALPLDGGPLGICHRGFLTGAQAALPEILARIPFHRPIAVTGHSLGGAMAICLTALLVTRGINPVVCTTFGAPAISIGDKLSKLIEHIPGDRYHCGDDPVPYVPTPPYGQDRKLTQIGVSKLDPIADHFIAAYSMALAVL